MAKGNISLPSGSGGVVRYFDQETSKIEFSPQALVMACTTVIILFIVLHMYYGGFF